jgi:hypothetical protein
MKVTKGLLEKLVADLNGDVPNLEATVGLKQRGN